MGVLSLRVCVNTHVLTGILLCLSVLVPFCMMLYWCNCPCSSDLKVFTLVLYHTHGIDLSSVFIHAILLAVNLLRAINNPSFVARIKHLQCRDGFIFIAFVSIYMFLEASLEGLYF